MFFFFLAEAIKVVTSPNWPMVSCQNGAVDSGNFSGASVDLIRKIALDLAWNDEEWTLECTSWTEMLSQVENNQADMAIAGIEISSDYFDKMEFSTPTFDAGLVLVVEKENKLEIWLLFEPFHYSLWIIIALIGVIMAHIVWILERDHEGEFQFAYRVGIMEAFWHVTASFFFTGDKIIKTIPGRIMQLSYWFMSFVLLSIYVANLTQRISMVFNYNEIQNYEDLDGKSVGVLEGHSLILKEFGAETETYSEAEELIEDLEEGKIDVVALPVPLATYYSNENCDLVIVGEIFVPNYYAIAFPLAAEEEFVKEVEIVNSRMNLNFVERNLLNKYSEVTEEDLCEEFRGYPLSIEDVAGVWIITGGTVLVAFPMFYLYHRCGKKQEEEEEEKVIMMKFDTKTAAEQDLISKFEHILASSEQKFVEKIRDLEIALSEHADESNTFEEALAKLSNKINE